jgi:hypothetical protein
MPILVRGGWTEGSSIRNGRAILAAGREPTCQVVKGEATGGVEIVAMVKF